MRSSNRSSMRARPATTSSKSLVSATRTGVGESICRWSYPASNLAIPLGVRRVGFFSGTVTRWSWRRCGSRCPFDALDLGSASQFRRWVLARIHTEAPPEYDVVLDLDDVEFVMAAGVQALLDLEAELAERGQSLHVAGSAPIVARVLDICGVAARWTVQ